jgi:hypothetical protein
LNLFSIDGVSISPAVLRILYALRFSRSDISRAQLVEVLRAHQYSDGEIMAAISSPMGLAHRLIYSSIHDHFVGIERWLAQGSAPVRLSSAGMGYLTVMLRIPAYSQWALTSLRAVTTRAEKEIAGTDFRTVRGRLMLVHLGYKLAIVDERRRIETTWRNYSGDDRQDFVRQTELAIQSASGDAFFASLDRFMDVYRVNHAAHAERRESQAAEFVSDAAQWVGLGRETIADHRRIFGYSVDSWLAAQLEAEQDLVAMERAIPAKWGHGAGQVLVPSR